MENKVDVHKIKSFKEIPKEQGGKRGVFVGKISKRLKAGKTVDEIVKELNFTKEAVLEVEEMLKVADAYKAAHPET